MLKIISRLSLVGVLILGACTSLQWADFKSRVSNDVTAVENAIAAFLAKAKANLPIYEADAKAIIGMACAGLPLLIDGAQALQGALAKPPAAVVQSVSATTTYGNRGLATCDAYSKATVTNPATGVDLINQGIGIANAYQAARTSLTIAQSQAGKMGQ
jgi:hypothetical protein